MRLCPQRAFVAAALALGITATAPSQAQQAAPGPDRDALAEALRQQAPEISKSPELFAEIIRGFEIAPVPLNLSGKNLALVGLGSYVVNAQGGCNDCHTNPS